MRFKVENDLSLLADDTGSVASSCNSQNNYTDFEAPAEIIIVIIKKTVIELYSFNHFYWFLKIFIYSIFDTVITNNNFFW